MDNTWKISRMNDDHSCGNFRVGGTNPQANSDWVSRVLMRKLRDNPNLKPKALVKMVKEDYETTVSYKVAWFAKEKALMKIRGSYSYSYQLLETYSHELMSVDPDAVTDILTGPGDRFECFFWTYGISVRVYKKNLRPVVIVDGTFLKGRYPGTILSAIAVDGNNHVFPLAFAVVMKEKNDSWDWFFTKLRDHVVGVDHQFILLSDRHKSIIQGVPKILPNAVHMYCSYHMSGKFGHKKIKFLVQESAKTLNQQEFWGNMLGIWVLSSKAHEKLMDVGPLEKWASAFQEKSRYGIVTTNHVESWNKMIIGERMMPVTTIVSMIRDNVIRHYRDYRNDSLKFNSPVTTWCQEQIVHNAAVARKCTLERASAGIWSVRGLKRSCVVDLNKRTCTCKWFQTMGIPCEHAMAAIKEVGFDPYKFVEVYYLKETYIETFREEWTPTRGKEEWPTDRQRRRILPPLKTSKAGRPKTARKRGKAEGVPVQSRRCSMCRVRGHNKSTCLECIDDYQLFSHTLFGEGPPLSPVPATI
ncbi:hypothetical protein AQUCO_05700012v1 [Aquilegia coerulea]|uniref:SWIM-type domain-containing protein n=1 Tax=Aquilegia coerulea TaxID=218851 RepID=A0A2G5CFF4_AQUCA|nr:hypothetical protein AQUCO_05700012v1 [Aquilegia coerulea]